MKSRIVQAGFATGAVLGIALVVGAVLGWTWLVALAGAGLGVALLVLATDILRRLRRLERRMGYGGPRDVGPAPAAVPVTEADVVGTVRLLQAQYTGRLDRLQETVEALVAAQGRSDRSGS